MGVACPRFCATSERRAGGGAGGDRGVGAGGAGADAKTVRMVAPHIVHDAELDVAYRPELLGCRLGVVF